MDLNPPAKEYIDERVELLSSQFETKEAMYISGPITTGKDFLNWYVTYGKQIANQEEYKKQHYNTVIIANLNAILSFTESVKILGYDKIIEPASLNVAEWTQPDYLYYWGQVISKYVRKIVFLDGWCYSNGCVYEYYVGLLNGLELVDQNFNALPIQNVISTISDSIQEFQENSIDNKFLQTALSKIKENEDIS